MSAFVNCEKFGELMTCDVAQALVAEYKSLPITKEASQVAFCDLLDYAKSHQPTICQVSFQGVPYQTYEQMKHEVLTTKVYEAGSGLMFPHPFWTPEDMGEYMAWHDVCGHMEIDADFTPDGESEVFTHHARELLAQGRDAAVDALCIEILYRIAWIILNGWTFEYRTVVPGPVGRNLISSLVLSE